jgi:phosphopantetheinyl transferase
VIAAPMVHAWLFPVVQGAADDPAMLSVLGHREIERVGRLGWRRDRDRAVCARVAARIEAGRRLGIAACEVPLDDDGPPSFRGVDTTVSWSHSGHWIALALGCGRPVGIDIEEEPEHLDLDALAELDVRSLEEFVALEAASKATACVYGGAWPPGVALRRLSAPRGYVAAVASTGSDWKVELHMRSPLHIVEHTMAAC